MSFEALAWAGKCNAGSAARKLVLLALADRHNTEEGVARPSIAWIAEWTDLNRKTIISALSELEKMGLISDSGMRAGATGQIKAYSLNFETVPKTEQSQKRNRSTFSRKQSQKRDTDTVRDTGSEAKASSPRGSGSKQGEVARPEGVSEQVWKDFGALRRKARAPISPTAMAGIAREAAKAGFTLEAALAECVVRGWRGFKAEWVEARQPANLNRPPGDAADGPDFAAIAAAARARQAAKSGVA